MDTFKNSEGKVVLKEMVKAIRSNKGYLSEIDGLIGDGDHGMNMNKGFSMFEERYAPQAYTFTEGLDALGTILLTEIGGSMGPIYGTIFMEMAEAGESLDEISLAGLSTMLRAGLQGLSAIVDAKVGDKTLVDTLTPAVEALESSVEGQFDFRKGLAAMVEAAERGKDSTKDLVAVYGRSSRLGERSRGVLDAGATSCCIILEAMSRGIIQLLDAKA